MPTAGYSIGASGGDAQLAYAPETTWGVVPGSGFKTMRITGESLAGAKERDRPNEIDGTWSGSSLVTTAVTAGGGVNFGASVGNFDDLMAAVFCNTWAAGVPGAGQDTLVDGKVLQSFTIEKRMQAGQYFRYPGAYPTGMTLNVATGQFVGGSFTFVAKNEAKSTTAAGAYAAAGTGRIINASAGVSAITLGGSPLGYIESMTLNVTRQGAAQQRGLGSVSALGIDPGILIATVEANVYFKDFTLYDAFVAESEQAFSFRTADLADKGYTWTLLAPVVDAPAPGVQDKTRPIMQRVSFTSNPNASGAHISVVRNLPA